MALFSPNTLAHASRYELAPTSAETRAMSENVYAETAHMKSMRPRAGTTATCWLLKAATPAASARTPEPTMFFARFTTVLETEAPLGLSPETAAAAIMAGACDRRC